MADTNSLPPPDAPPVRKRPKPGERRVQILQALATTSSNKRSSGGMLFLARCCSTK